MNKVSSHPWDSQRGGFWNAPGGYERMLQRYEMDMKKYGGEVRPRRFRMSNAEKIRRGMVPKYAEGRSYTHPELELMADALIYGPGWTADGSILNYDMYRRRLKHEVYTNLGTPDPSIVSGFYWRTHPQGLPFETKTKRIEGAKSFYRD